MYTPNGNALTPGLLFVTQQYPDYYAIIKDPIDLRIIAQKIQVSVYTFSIDLGSRLWSDKSSIHCIYMSFFRWVTTGVSVPWRKTLICSPKMPRITTNQDHKFSRYLVNLSICLFLYLSVPCIKLSCSQGRKHHQKVICPEEGRHGPCRTHQVQHTHQVNREKSLHLWKSPRYSQSHPCSPLVCQLLSQSAEAALSLCPLFHRGQEQTVHSG